MFLANTFSCPCVTELRGRFFIVWPPEWRDFLFFGLNIRLELLGDGGGGAMQCSVSPQNIIPFYPAPKIFLGAR